MFRFRKTEIRRLDLEGLIRHRLEAEHVNRGTNTTPMEQLLVTMRYLASGCFSRVTADFPGVSTLSANRIIHRVCITSIAFTKKLGLRLATNYS